MKHFKFFTCFFESQKIFKFLKSYRLQLCHDLQKEMCPPHLWPLELLNQYHCHPRNEIVKNVTQIYTSLICKLIFNFILISLTFELSKMSRKSIFLPYSSSKVSCWSFLLLFKSCCRLCIIWKIICCLLEMLLVTLNI